MNAIVPASAQNALVPHSLNEAMALADRMARAKLVPQALQNSPGDCLMVVELAMRWGMSPFAVAQEVSVIQGKMMCSGKITAAAIQTAPGVLDGRLRYDYEGEGDQRRITITGRLRGETENRSITVHLKDARTSNGMWTKQPDQQLAYHGARVWARRYVPEVMLGVWTPEEMETRDTFTGTTIELQPEPVRGQPQETAAAIGDSIPALDDGPDYPFETAKGGKLYRSASEWTEAWRRTIEACKRTAALDKLQSAREMNAGAIQAVAEFDADAAAEVNQALDEALGETVEA